MTLLPEPHLETPRPSNLGRIIACPGSRRLVPKVPEQPSTRWADAGTAAHYVGEQCLSSGRAPFEYFGQKILVNGAHYAVDAEVVVAVSKYVHHVKTDRRDMGPGTLMFLERRLFVPDIDNGGMVDCLLVNRDTMQIHVHDYKHGEGVYVSETWNAQFLAYGVGGALEIFPGVPFERLRFKFVVHQPRFPDQPPVRAQELPGSEVTRWRQEVLRPALEAGRSPDAPLRAGDHCQFCAAKKICMAYLNAPRRPFQKAPIKPDAIPAGFTF